MRQSNVIGAVFCASLAAGAVACSGGSTIKPFDAAKNFPTEERLAELKAEPPGKPTFKDAKNEGRVDYWELAGPLPTTWGSQTIRSDSPVAQAIDAGFEKARMTESMSCYAREVGIFYVHYEKFPYPELDDFMKRRCGMLNDQASVQSWGFERPDMPEHEFLEASNWGDFLEGVTSGDSDSNEYGVWLGSGRHGTFVMVTRAAVPAKVEPIALNQAPNAEVVFEGELSQGADYVFGLMTRGEYGHGSCATTQGLDAPKFRVTCKLEGDDPTVFVTISKGNDSDVFSNTVLGAEFVRPQARRMLFVAEGASVPAPEPQATTPTTVAEGGLADDSPDAGEQPAEGEDSLADAANSGASADAVERTETAVESAPAPIPRPALIQKPMNARNMEPVALRRRLHEGINRVRREAGRSEVVLEVEQSDTNLALIPYAFTDNNDAKNEALLGAMAGWQVKSAIVDGSFRSRYLTHGDVDDFLVSILRNPAGRQLLLSDEVSAVAIGSSFDEESQSAAILLTSYEFLKERPHTERVAEFMERLTEARAARGASAPKLVGSLKGPANRLAAGVKKGEYPFHEAVESLWNQGLNTFQRSTHIYYAAVHDPLKLTFNEQLLSVEPLEVGIMVTPFKPSGSPWHIYGVAITYPKGTSATQVAESESTDGDVVQRSARAAR